MITPNTSHERAQELVQLSDKVYPAIDQIVNDETRARRMMRLGIQVVALTVGVGRDYRTRAGDAWIAVQQQELSRGGITTKDYVHYPRYQQMLGEIPCVPDVELWNESLDGLAQKYADIRRATIASNGSYETDATHAIHLSALATAYAAEYHPELHLSTVALYALIHDIVEAYAGDTPSLGLNKKQRHEKARIEKAALERIVREFGDKFPEFIQACKDYENLADDEAKFIKTFDKLDPSFTHISNGCLAIRRDMKIDCPQQLRALNQQTEDSMTYADKFPQLLSVRRELTSKVIASARWGEKIPT